MGVCVCLVSGVEFKSTLVFWTNEMALVSGTNLMAALAELEDPRRPSNGTLHDFQEILVIAICAMLSDVDNLEDIALWGRLKEHWLKRFLTLKKGIPLHDTFERVFRILCSDRFEAVFRQWVGGVITTLGGQMAIDGKVPRGSADGDSPPAHMVSAFATNLGVVLGQEKVADKSNEITVIPIYSSAKALGIVCIVSGVMFRWLLYKAAFHRFSQVIGCMRKGSGF